MQVKLHSIVKGPYKGRICYLKRKDVSNEMWWVFDSITKEMLFVHDDELDVLRIKRYKLKIKDK